MVSDVLSMLDVRLAEGHTISFLLLCADLIDREYECDGYLDLSVHFLGKKITSKIHGDKPDSLGGAASLFCCCAPRPGCVELGIQWIGRVRVSVWNGRICTAARVISSRSMAASKSSRPSPSRMGRCFVGS